jgi:hypothetical protein
MKTLLRRIVPVAIMLAIPAVVLAAGKVAESCCPGGSCCPLCPFC